MSSCIRITRACVAGHPILGELAGHRKTEASRGGPKLVAGCYLSDRRRKVNRQPPQRKAMFKPRRRHDKAGIWGDAEGGAHRSEKSKAEQQAHIHEGFATASAGYEVDARRRAGGRVCKEQIGRASCRASGSYG